MNTTVTLTSNNMTATSMTFAKNLQAMYDSMGSPSTQNIRNPFPLHRLIVAVLPTHKGKALTRTEIQEKLLGQGYIVNKSTLQMVLSTMNVNNKVNSARLTDKEVCIRNYVAKKMNDATRRVTINTRKYYFSLGC